jgi:hypothetical protein
MRANKCLLNSSQKSHIEKTIWGLDWIQVVQDRLTQERSCEHGNEHLFSRQCGECFKQLSNYQILEKAFSLCKLRQCVFLLLKVLAGSLSTARIVRKNNIPTYKQKTMNK